MGRLPTGEVFFKTEANTFQSRSWSPGITAFPVEVSVPYAGTYEVALRDRRGADEFSRSAASPCKATNVRRRGNTDSFYICKSDPRLEHGSNGQPSTAWLNEHCTTYHCCGRSHPFDLAQGGNTLWLTAREICSTLPLTLPLTPTSNPLPLSLFSNL